MRTRSTIVLALTAWLIAAGHPAGAARAQRPLAFGHAFALQQIGRDTLAPSAGIEGDTQVEPDIGVSPRCETCVVAVMQNGRDPTGGAQTIAYSTTDDGGRTWTAGNLPGVTTATGGSYNRASDPAVAIGADGTVYAVSLVFNTSGPNDGVAVSRSFDGGKTWVAPVFPQQDSSNSDDKEWIAVDSFPASPRFGRVYVAWDAGSAFGQPIFLRWSDDQGVTWSARTTVSSSSAVTIGARPVVQPNGDLSIVYENAGAGTIVAQTSHDGGATFAAAVKVATDNASDPPDMRAGSDLPSAAVDPTTGILYVAWGDVRFRTDGTMDAVVSRSTDGGATWSAPVRANQDPTTDGVTHTTPAVAAYGGFVHVTYRARRKTAGGYGKLVGMGYIVSADGGLTFGGELALGKPSDLTYAAQAGGRFLGDYMGLAASAHAVHPVWCRSFAPPTPQTYHQTTWSAVILKGSS